MLYLLDWVLCALFRVSCRLRGLIRLLLRFGFWFLLIATKAIAQGKICSTHDCFKSSWSTHKSIHLKEKLSALELGAPGEQNSASPNNGWLYCLKKGQARTPKLPHFDWTGLLRPYHISRRRAVPAHTDQPDWAMDALPGARI